MVNFVSNSDELNNTRLVEEADTSIMTKAAIPNPEDTVGDDAQVTEFEDGSVEVDFNPTDELPEDRIEAFDEIDDSTNLADFLDKEELEDIGRNVVERLEEDLSSRSEMDVILAKGLRMLGLTDTSDEEIFDGSATVYHPLIIEQAVDFQSKAITELMPSKGPVKTQILGDVTEELQKQANRVQRHMNYQIQHQMTEYYDDKERMLFYVANCGSAFTKGYYDTRKKRPVVEFIPIEDFVVNYNAKSLEDAYCYTHIIKQTVNDMIRNQISGFYTSNVDISDLGSVMDTVDDEVTEIMDEAHGLEKPNNALASTGNGEIRKVYEQHCYLDLPEPYNHPDGLELPYIVHVDAESEEVLAIYKNWEDGDLDYNKTCWFTHYKYVPGTGFYGLGNIHLLGNLTKSMTLSLRSLLDAGMLANTTAGFKSKKAKIVNPDSGHAIGEWKDIEGMVPDLAKAFYKIEYKEPSQTLFYLLKEMNDMSHRFADKADQIISESSNTGPVGTTIALLEASMKFFSAIHKRMHNSQKHEFKLIAKINYMYLDAGENSLLIPNSTLKITKEDYNDRIDILPVSDPNMPSNAHRVTMAQTKLQAAQQAPHIHNMKEAYREFYNAIGYNETDDVLPYDKEAIQQSPMEDIESAMKGEPIKAFKGQDHEAHIATKMAWIESPTGGQSRLFSTVTPSIQANIREHLFEQFKTQVEGSSENPEDDAANAMAAQDVSKFQQEKAKAEQEGGLDPAKQMLAKAEFMNAQSRSQEVQHKVQKENAELGLKVQELEIDEAETAAKIAQTDAKLDLDRIKIGSDMVDKAVGNLMKPSSNKSVDKPKDSE